MLTHRTDDPHDESFLFVDDLAEALRRAREAAGDMAVSISGGADVIRQGLAAGEVDELCLSVAPVVLRAGKPLFDGGPALGLDRGLRRHLRGLGGRAVPARGGRPADG